MTRNPLRTTLLVPALAGALAMTGCAGQQKKPQPFFTSGSPEADQRADQRMAKDRQLKGGNDADDDRKVTKASDESKGDKAGADTAVRAPAKQTLYERLGGEPAVDKIVDDFVTRALADPRVNWERKGVTQGGFSWHRNRSVEWHGNVEVMKKHIAQFIALATGGPPTYGGKEMKQAHAGLHIANAEFDAAVGDLKATLDKLQIPNQEQKELLAIVESTRPQVVEER